MKQKHLKSTFLLKSDIFTVHPFVEKETLCFRLWICTCMFLSLYIITFYAIYHQITSPILAFYVDIWAKIITWYLRFCMVLYTVHIPLCEWRRTYTGTRKYVFGLKWLSPHQKCLIRISLRLSQLKLGWIRDVELRF